MLRDVGDDIENRDAELVIFLSSLQLDEVPTPGDHLSLPQVRVSCRSQIIVSVSAMTFNFLKLNHNLTQNFEPFSDPLFYSYSRNYTSNFV